MRQAVGGEAMAFAIADRGIVDHRIEAAEFIDLGSNILGAGDGLEVADDDRLGLGQRAPGVFCAGGVAGMQDDLVALATSSSAAIRPRPVDEPEMKMRAM